MLGGDLWGAAIVCSIIYFLLLNVCAISLWKSFLQELQRYNTARADGTRNDGDSSGKLGKEFFRIAQILFYPTIWCFDLFSDIFMVVYMYNEHGTFVSSNLVQTCIVLMCIHPICNMALTFFIHAGRLRSFSSEEWWDFLLLQLSQLTHTRMLLEVWKASGQKLKSFELWQVKMWQTVFQSISLMILQIYFVLGFPNEVPPVLFLWSWFWSMASIVLTVMYQDFKGLHQITYEQRFLSGIQAYTQVCFRLPIFLLRCCEILLWSFLMSTFGLIWHWTAPLAVYLFLNIFGVYLRLVTSEEAELRSEGIQYALLNAVFFDPMTNRYSAKIINIMKFAIIVVCLVFFWVAIGTGEVKEVQNYRWITMIVIHGSLGALPLLYYYIIRRNVWNYEIYEVSCKRDLLALVNRNRAEEAFYLIRNERYPKEKFKPRQAWDRIWRYGYSAPLLMQHNFFPYPETILGLDSGMNKLQEILQEGEEYWPKEQRHLEEIFDAWSKKYFRKIDKVDHDDERYEIFESDTRAVKDIKDKINDKVIEHRRLQAQVDGIAQEIQDLKEELRIKQETESPAPTPPPSPPVPRATFRSHTAIEKDQAEWISENLRIIFFDEITFRLMSCLKIESDSSSDILFAKSVGTSELQKALEDLLKSSLPGYIYEEYPDDCISRFLQAVTHECKREIAKSKILEEMKNADNMWIKPYLRVQEILSGPERLDVEYGKAEDSTHPSAYNLHGDSTHPSAYNLHGEPSISAAAVFLDPPPANHIHNGSDIEDEDFTEHRTVLARQNSDHNAAMTVNDIQDDFYLEHSMDDSLMNVGGKEVSFDPVPTAWSDERIEEPLPLPMGNTYKQSSQINPKVTLAQLAWYLYEKPYHPFVTVMKKLLDKAPGGYESMSKPTTDDGKSHLESYLDQQGLMSWNILHQEKFIFSSMQQDTKLSASPGMRTFLMEEEDDAKMLRTQKFLRAFRVIQDVPWFINLTDAQKSELANKATFMKLNPESESNTIAYQEYHDYLYIVIHGELRFDMPKQDCDGFPLRSYDVFGYKVFIKNAHQAEKVVATTECQLYRIPAKDVKDVFDKNENNIIEFWGRGWPCSADIQHVKSTLSVQEPSFYSTRRSTASRLHGLDDHSTRSRAFFLEQGGTVRSISRYHSANDFRHDTQRSVQSHISHHVQSISAPEVPEDATLKAFLMKVPLFGCLLHEERDACMRAAKSKICKSSKELILDVENLENYLYIVQKGTAQIYDRWIKNSFSSEAGDFIYVHIPSNEMVPSESKLEKQIHINPVGNDGIRMIQIEQSVLQSTAFSGCWSIFRKFQARKKANYKADSKKYDEDFGKAFEEVKGSFNTTYQAMLDSSNHEHVLMIKIPKTVLKEEKKVIEKGDSRKVKAIDYVRQGKLIQSMIDSPFIKKHIGSFHDVEYFYMIESLPTGGSLDKLIKSGYFQDHWDDGVFISKERSIRFYAACMFLAIEHLHQHRIVHRNIRPENFWLRGDGYPVLGNFGYAKHIGYEKTNTVCGLGDPHYHSWEMVHGMPYGIEADYWAFGVSLHRMIFMQNPYEDIQELNDRGLQQWVCFSRECNNFLRDLLHPDKYHRLGMDSRRQAVGIRQHAWFELELENSNGKLEKFDWVSLENQKSNPTYVDNASGPVYVPDPFHIGGLPDADSFEIEPAEKVMRAEIDFFSIYNAGELYLSGRKSKKDEFAQFSDAFQQKWEFKDAQEILNYKESQKNSMMEDNTIELNYLTFDPVTSLTMTVKPVNYSQEIEEIKLAIKASDYNVRLSRGIFDVLNFLNEDMHILHIAGHGVQDYLLLEDGYGRAKAIQRGENDDIDQEKFFEKLNIKNDASSVNVFWNHKQNLKLVVYLSCHSEFGGRIFANLGVDHVICIQSDKTVLNRDCEQFSRIFYINLFKKNKTIQESFQLATEILDEDVFLLLGAKNHNVNISDATEVKSLANTKGEDCVCNFLPLSVPHSMDIKRQFDENADILVDPTLIMKVFKYMREDSKFVVVHGPNKESRLQMIELIASSTLRLVHFRDGVFVVKFSKRVDSVKYFEKQIYEAISADSETQYKDELKGDRNGDCAELLKFLSTKSVSIFICCSEDCEDDDWFPAEPDLRQEIGALLEKLRVASSHADAGSTGAVCISLAAESLKSVKAAVPMNTYTEHYVEILPQTVLSDNELKSALKDMDISKDHEKTSSSIPPADIKKLLKLLKIDGIKEEYATSKYFIRQLKSFLQDGTGSVSELVEDIKRALTDDSDSPVHKKKRNASSSWNLTRLVKAFELGEKLSSYYLKDLNKTEELTMEPVAPDTQEQDKIWDEIEAWLSDWIQSPGNTPKAISSPQMLKDFIEKFPQRSKDANEYIELIKKDKNYLEKLRLQYVNCAAGKVAILDEFARRYDPDDEGYSVFENRTEVKKICREFDVPFSEVFNKLKKEWEDDVIEIEDGNWKRTPSSRRSSRRRSQF